MLWCVPSVAGNHEKEKQTNKNRKKKKKYEVANIWVSFTFFYLTMLLFQSFIESKVLTAIYSNWSIVSGLRVAGIQSLFGTQNN